MNALSDKLFHSFVRLVIWSYEISYRSRNSHVDILLIRYIKQNKMTTKFNTGLKDFNHIKARAFRAVKFETVWESR